LERLSDLLLPLGILAATAVAAYLLSERNSVAPEPVYDPWGEQPMNTPSPLPQFSPRALSTSDNGRALVETSEGKSYTAYPDTGGLWTIGIGHLIVPGDGLLSLSAFALVNGRYIVTDIPAVKALGLDENAVQNLFNNDLSDAENTVKSYVVVPLTQGQFDALVDFVFNLGAGNLGNSTLLKRINARDYAGAATEFAKWINGRDAQGNLVQIPGLIARRQADTQTYLA
jgi:lysozyme